MAHFHHAHFFTEILKDDDLMNILAQLCVDPDPETSKSGDILAVEFPYISEEGNMDSRGFPARVLVRDLGKQFSARRVPWYALVESDVPSEKITLIGQAFGRMSRHWCLSLKEQMATMTRARGETSRPFDLLVGPGYGFLLINSEDDDDHALDPDVHNTTERIQRHILSHSALALPAAQNGHERVRAQTIAAKACALGAFTWRYVDPRDYQEIRPLPRPV